MDTLLVVVLVGGAVAYAARRVWLSLRASKKSASGCGSDCGCH